MKFNRLVALFIVISLAFSAAGAESLFSMLNTPAPEPTAAPAPAAACEPGNCTGGLFAHFVKATPAPTPAATPTPAPIAA